MLTEVLRCVGLTHLVQLQAANQNRNLPTGAFWLPEEPREGQQQAPVIYQMPAITTPDGVGPLPPAAQATSLGEPASAKKRHASGFVLLSSVAAASAVQALLPAHLSGSAVVHSAALAVEMPLFQIAVSILCMCA